MAVPRTSVANSSAPSVASTIPAHAPVIVAPADAIQRIGPPKRKNTIWVEVATNSEMLASGRRRPRSASRLAMITPTMPGTTVVTASRPTMPEPEKCRTSCR